MRKSYNLRDLDCAVCADKMERAIGKLPGVTNARVNFLTQRMSIDFAEGANTEEIMKEVVRACRKVEPDCEVLLK
jgi:copper chaperone CopZ